MIKAENRVFELRTDNTLYLFEAGETGHLLHLYYGASIPVDGGTLQALRPRIVNANGTSIMTDGDHSPVTADGLCLEASARGRGDMGEPFVELEYADGCTSCDLRYDSFRVEDGTAAPDGLPGAAREGGETLVVTLRDAGGPVRLELVYSVFEGCDCITRFARLINDGEQGVTVGRLMSAQLDCRGGEWQVATFRGDWGREMGRCGTALRGGKFVSDSLVGFSSNRANPFVMFAAPDAGETHGECYACNLLYSGNHRECFEVGSHGRMRMLTGIHPDTFRWSLGPGEGLCAPQAVLTWAGDGWQGISRHMHAFVRGHITRGAWQYKPRPVLINSWEAVYFNVHEAKLLRLAREARDVGVELFVLDDGWFGKRDNDRRSLGDWQDNPAKLPNGLAGLSEKIRALGLDFGIWVEPEMVNEDSELYRAHPDWAVRAPGRSHARGRNQMLLDLTRQEVREFIVEAMSDVFRRGQVSYVKWDMNRDISDYYSQALPPQRQGEFAHRYILGLYAVLGELTARFPEVLFEACASGGNRSDLGMLCYMQQVWASDCTDAAQRTVIQDGYSYGYPQSVLGCHVSACPNHQTLRVTPLDTRFAVACAGLLGYECDLCDAGAGERGEIKKQIALYKQWRDVLQYGQLHRLGREGDGAVDTDLVRWQVTAPDKGRAVVITVQGRNIPNLAPRRLRTRGLDEGKTYRFYSQPRRIDVRRLGSLVNMVSPVHIRQGSLAHSALAKVYRMKGDQEDVTVNGGVLNRAGVELSPVFAGTGAGEGTAVYQDYDARMYFIEEV